MYGAGPGRPWVCSFSVPGFMSGSGRSDGDSWSSGSRGLDPPRGPASTLGLHQALVLQLLERQPDRRVADPGKGDPHVGDLKDLRRVLEHILTDSVLLRPRRPVERGPLLEPLVGPREDLGEVRQPGPRVVGLLMPGSRSRSCSAGLPPAPKRSSGASSVARPGWRSAAVRSLPVVGTTSPSAAGWT